MSAAAMTRSEADGRAASLMTIIPVVSVFISLGLAADRNRSFFALMMREPVLVAIMAPLLITAVFAGIRTLRPTTPVGVSQKTLTVLVWLVLFAAMFLVVVFALEEGRSHDDEPTFWAMTPWPLMAGWVLGRASRMKGWSAWANKLAALILSCAPLLFMTMAMHAWERDSFPTFILFDVGLVVVALPLAFFVLFRVGRTPKAQKSPPEKAAPQKAPEDPDDDA